MSNLEKTLVLIKPDAILRGLTGEIVDRFVKRGLKIAGIKMLQASDKLLEEHYAHIASKSFFPGVKAGMQRTPIIAIAFCGIDAANVARAMAGTTNARTAAPGTLRGDYAVSIQQNIVHISDSPEAAATEVVRFFKPEELFTPTAEELGVVYGADEIK